MMGDAHIPTRPRKSLVGRLIATFIGAFALAPRFARFGASSRPGAATKSARSRAPIGVRGPRAWPSGRVSPCAGAGPRTRLPLANPSVVRVRWGAARPAEVLTYA